MTQANQRRSGWQPKKNNRPTNNDPNNILICVFIGMLHLHNTCTRIFTQIHTHKWGFMGLKKKVTEENIIFVSTFNNFRVCLPAKEHSYINKNIQEQFHCNLIFVYMVSHDLCSVNISPLHIVRTSRSVMFHYTLRHLRTDLVRCTYYTRHNHSTDWVHSSQSSSTRHHYNFAYI